MIDTATINTFLTRLGHPVALVGQKPVADARKVTVIWPAEIDDVADQCDWLSHHYYSVYCNLNPLADYLLDVVPERGRSIADAMIARRTRILIDIDGHDGQHEMAREQKDAIKARLGPPLIETMSGNGFACLYSCDLPNDDDSKQRVAIFLQRLNADFPCVDTSVFGAGRLTRVIGTPNRSRITNERIPTELL